MDPSKTALGKMILEHISPVVMLLSTPLVEESSLKNNISFLQLLSPFSSFSNIDVPVRTSSDQPYRIKDFRLRLFYDSHINHPSPQVAKERLKQVITQAGDETDSELCSDPPPLGDILASSESEILPSWVEYFNKELINTVSFSEQEAFDHPVACLLVVSSKDEQPINRFVDLFNSNKLPSLLNDGVMDPKILKHYLLVHDNQDDNSERAMKILTEMKNTFGSNECHLLCINSSQDGKTEHTDNPWTPYKSDALPGQQLGRYLNVDDCNEVKDLMQELTSKHIIPYMEQKVRVLNQQVSATRKGFRNQIKNLWWRKGKEETTDSPEGSTYTFSSIESQIRVLGDYAFMLRDYELALSNYRLISTDYKLDKAWKRYAAVQEMMGLTYFMLDQSRKEAEYCMENALSTYFKIGSSGQQNATRCGLWWVEMLKTGNQFKEAAAVYFRICSEDLLYSAVMLEQASYCYLLSQPSMLHKYGFHLVLSGDRYRRCDQVKHAIRTYKRAISVYKGTTWSYIKDHVYFHIGQWYSLLGLYDIAASYMFDVLACSHQSKTIQELFLRDFLQIIQKAGKTFEVLRLQLPVINISSLNVVFEDHRTFASPASASVKESIWRSLEEEMIPSLPSARTNWLDLQSKLLPKKFKESNICVAGEAVKVNIEFKNPLQIPISVSDVSLICELSARSDDIKSDADGSNSEVRDDEEYKRLGNITSDDSLILSKVEFSMGGGETTTEQLTVTPKVEGDLRIVGVRWKLSGSVVGVFNFESSLAKKKVSKGRRKLKNAPQNDMKFVVIKNQPRLEGFIHALPKKAYAGDLQHAVLELRNSSELPIKNLKMKISHPRFISLGKQEDLNAKIPACLHGKTNSEEAASRGDIKRVSNGAFVFPEDIAVQGETPLSWPVWFRAAMPGNISLYAVIYYEMEDATSVMKYRTLRMNYNFEVLPSLDVSYNISPCPSKLQEFLVRMDVINKSSSENFQLNQLSTVGRKWEIMLLQPADNIFPAQSLIAGQALSCFFKLKSSRKLSSDTEKVSQESFGRDVKLVPEGSERALFDISRSPLADFHCSERIQHKKFDQEDASKVDFILISRLLKNESNREVSESAHLFSYHECCCSTASTSPISWVVDGPQTMHHDFSASFCEINMKMTIYNSSDAAASVEIDTYDSPSTSGQLSDATAGSSGNLVGWHDSSIVSEIKVTSDVLGTLARKPPPPTHETAPPFIWSGSSSTRIQLQPMSSMDIPLQICVFSPGSYDLSNYAIKWKLLLANVIKNPEETKKTWGTTPGYPYHLTVLKSE